LTRLSSEQPTEPFWPYRLAETLVEEAQLEAAEYHLKAALERDPGYEPALALLSKTYFETARFDESVALLEGARARRSGVLPVELATALALNYEALGKSEEAQSIAESVEHRALDWKRNGSALVYLRLKGSEYLSSPEIARKALDADPSNAANFNNYGIAQLYGGDPEGAKKSFLKALDIDSELPGALYNLAIVDRFYFFDDDAALDWWKRYRKLSDEDPDGLENVLSPPSEQAAASRPTTTRRQHRESLPILAFGRSTHGRPPILQRGPGRGSGSQRGGH
jgi:tetratricopeptide (TPR) repeat protein